ncbi:hypothetical protein V1512DRAFT_230313 [Lipomyces arxii]|uniref:uncharacterized protein n=1 Tax=Lipomyces arxii TaxID=56418 RepID=UPI0034CD7B1D
MDRSGIETLLQAAALDPMFYNQPGQPMKQKSLSKASQSLSARRQSQQFQRIEQIASTKPLISPANSPDSSYCLYPSSENRTGFSVEQQPSQFSLPDMSPNHERSGSGESPTDQKWDHCNLCSPTTSPQGKIDWIECSLCQQWFHYQCVGLTTKEARNVDEYHCPQCSKIYGPSTLLRKSKRKHAAIDYVALHEGESVSLSADHHPYCEIVRNRNFAPEKFARISGHQLTKEFVESGGLSEPVVIPRSQSEGLDLEIPDGLTVKGVVEMVGPEASVEVIDVPTQHESPNWDLQRWAEYYYMPASLRDRVRNVISLEVSFTSLGESIRKPKFVRDSDLLQFWPEELKDRGEWPKVSLYCLMSVENAYTDFHIDFGGSSVFYHVVDGAKVFLFAPPIPSNLSKYEQWCLSSDQNKIFLGDLVKDCSKVQLNKGDTMIIPSGWIHAVYTPVDSLVIGGNFLTARDLSMEIHIDALEKKTKVPQKFRFPMFSRLLWYTADSYMEAKRDCSQIDRHELKSLADLSIYLHDELLVAAGKFGEAKSSRIRAAKSAIPFSLKDASRFIKEFANWVTSGLHVEPFEWATLTSEEYAEAGKPYSTFKFSRRQKRWPSSAATPIQAQPHSEAKQEPSVQTIMPICNHVGELHDVEVDKVSSGDHSVSIPESLSDESAHKAPALDEEAANAQVKSDNSVNETDINSDCQSAVKNDNRGNDHASDAESLVKPEDFALEVHKSLPTAPPNYLPNDQPRYVEDDDDDDVLSEVSTEFGEDFINSILYDESRTISKPEQESMDIHNSSGRKSIKDTLYRRATTLQRSSLSVRQKVDTERAQPQRRKSAPSDSRRVVGETKCVRLEKDTPTVSKRSRGRPRKGFTG